MKYTTVKLSEVQKGNGCMLPNRLLDECGDCDRVMRCLNKQAVPGRVQNLESKRLKMLAKMNKVDKKLRFSRWQYLKLRLKTLFRKED